MLGLQKVGRERGGKRDLELFHTTAQEVEQRGYFRKKFRKIENMHLI
jgi:hypothetical protein